MNQKVVKDYLFLFVVAGSLIALDQWTKWLVRQNIEFGAQWLPQGMEWLSPYARIVHWYNSGAAFGMFQNGNLVFTDPCLPCDRRDPLLLSASGSR